MSRNPLKPILQIALLPFAVVYGVVTEIRNLLYDLKFLPVYKAQIPVISIGNLTAGGSGKTPFTMFLIRELQGRFKRIAVVSRGYRRNSKGFKLVSQDGHLLSDVWEAGDEPYLIARKFPEVLVAVAEKRRVALEWIERNQAADLVILDDAFQHRSVARAVDIVLFKKTSGMFFLLPAGRLREMPYRIKRASFVVSEPEMKIPFVDSTKLWQNRSYVEGWVDAQLQKKYSIEDLKGKRAIAFAGIASPQSFFDSVQKSGVQLVRTFSFSDHYRFSPQDLKRMTDICKKEKVKYLLCTEKDMVKVASFAKDVLDGDVQLLALDYRLEVENKKDFVQALIKELTNK